MSTLRLGLKRIHVGSVAQISWERVTLLKGFPIWLNKGDLQRRGRENGESIQKTRPLRRCSRNMTCCQIFSGSNSLGTRDFEIVGIKKECFTLSKKLIESFICACYYDSLKETVRGKWGRLQALDLKERISVTPWLLALGPIRMECSTSRPAKLIEKGRRCSLEIWQCHVGGATVSGTRKTLTSEPKLCGAWFPQCGNSVPQEILRLIVRDSWCSQSRITMTFCPRSMSR